VTVTEIGSGTYTQQITAGRHQLFADEPQPIGEDAGPTPYDLLLAALGACTSMTVRMYANLKGWPLERVEVALRHTRIHAEDSPWSATSMTPNASGFWRSPSGVRSIRR
jgi:putative redox protein